MAFKLLAGPYLRCLPWDSTAGTSASAPTASASSPAISPAFSMAGISSTSHFLDPRAPTDARKMAFGFARTKLLSSRAFARMGSRVPTLLMPFLRQQAFPCPQQTIGVLCFSLPECASSPLMPFLSWQALSSSSEPFLCPRQSAQILAPGRLVRDIFVSVLEEFARAAPDTRICCRSTLVSTRPDRPSRCFRVTVFLLV